MAGLEGGITTNVDCKGDYCGAARKIGDVRVSPDSEYGVQVTGPGVNTPIVIPPGGKMAVAENQSVEVMGPNTDARIELVNGVNTPKLPQGKEINLERLRDRAGLNDPSSKGDFAATLEEGAISVNSGQLVRYPPEQMKIRTPNSFLGSNG